MDAERLTTMILGTEPSPCRGNNRFVGDPVDVVTGANTDITVDFRLNGPLPLRWRRYYDSSRNTIAGSMGWGHTHDFNRTLTYDLEGMHITDPLGGTVVFPPLHVGRRAVNAGLVLHRATEKSYELWQTGQPVQEFEFNDSSDTALLSRLRQGGTRINLRYDSSGRLREIIDSLQRSISVETDHLGKIVGLFLEDVSAPKGRRALMLYQYDAAGNLAVGRDTYNATLRFRWDPHHRMTCRIDRRGYSFLFKYDDEGRCIHSRGEDGLLEVFLDYHPDAKTTFVRRGDGGQWIYTYNENKTITQIADPEGNATKFVLDDRGRPLQEIDPNGNVITLHYDWRGGHDYRIDPNGNILPTKDADPNPFDPLAYELPSTDLEWDFGRLVSAKGIQPSSTSDPILSQFPPIVANSVTNKPARFGDRENTRTPFGSENAADVGSIDQSLEPPAPRFAQSWKHDANGNLVEYRDPDGSVYQSVYTSWNALTQSIDPLGNATTFNLTVQGLMAKVTDPGGTVTEYTYDLRERLIEVREGGRLVESYRRDPAGNVIEKRNASNKTLLSWVVGAGNLDKIRILASGEKHIFEHGAGGRIIKAESPTGIVTFAYSEHGDLLGDQRDGQGVVHEFEFKRLIGTTYFGNFRVRYRSAGDGRLVIQDPTGAKHNIESSQTGLIAKFMANGSRELSEFDAEGRCLRKALARSAEDAFPWLRKYEYSPAGDLVVVVDNKSGTTKYRHDAAHRLTEELPPFGPSRSFEFDRAGNLLKQPGLTGVVIGDCNRLREAGGEVYTYNDRCNLSQRQGPSGVTRYEYDDLDMLVRCEIKGEIWAATYDGLCRRVQKVWRNETTRYFWDDFRLAAELRHNGSCRLYIYADQTALAPFLFVEYESLKAPPESGLRYYIFTNQVGAPIRVEDNAGQAVWSARIDPYGTAHVDSGSKIELQLRFPGHYFDPETGLHYNRFRYFSPELGRYLQSDPAGLAGGINAYAYPSRPLTVVDIDGLGRKKVTPPKTKDGPPPQVGCSAPVSPGLSPEEVKAQLEAKSKKLMDDIAKAKEAGLTHVTAPDGTVLQIHPTAGPCLSVAYDKVTGKVYYGQNTDGRPSPMHPILADNADRAARENHEKGYDKPYKKTVSDGKGGTKEITVQPPYGMYPMKGVPGDHSEVNAVNKGMVEREEASKTNSDIPPPHPNDYTVHNTNTNGQGQGEGQGKPCCPNCKRVLGGPGGQGPGATDVS